ncbi:MAG TPA: CbiX/SirB N-terminal domain-containing protein [Rubrivivax sp.]|nr:CbiX/SirB N-terminal domain-containing protein [Rubrivivax sp.]
MSRRGLILFAHGARDARWAAPFESVAALVRQQRPALQTRLAFLELMAPTLAEAGAQLCAAGCSRVDVLPMFLGTGGHLRHDLPPMVEQLREKHPQVHWTLHPPVGELDAVVQAMAAAALALSGGRGA